MSTATAGGSVERWIDLVLAAYGEEGGARETEKAVGASSVKGAVDRVDRTVHGDDEMLLEAIEAAGGDHAAGGLAYFLTGCQVARVIRQLAGQQRGPEGGSPRILDMGCGYGRLGRHLAHDTRSGAGIDPQRVWVSDLLTGALSFQTERFGFHSFVSSTAPSGFAAPVDFDLIWAGSLFTHLSEERFGEWLEVLFACLAPGGVLAFTVHDEDLIPTGYRPNAGGVLHLPSSESRTLSTDDYGTSWVSVAFVDRQIECHLVPTPPLVQRLPRAIVGYQDLWVLKAPGEDQAPQPLSLELGPRGMVEWLAIDRPGVLEVSGWAWDSAAERRVECVEVVLDGRVFAKLEELSPRPDVSSSASAEVKEPVHAGFSVEVPLPTELFRRDALLEVRARTSGGQLWPLRVGGLESLLGVLAREALEAERLRVFALEREIEWMRQSRFWHMRESWFALKQIMGARR